MNPNHEHGRRFDGILPNTSRPVPVDAQSPALPGVDSDAAAAVSAAVEADRKLRADFRLALFRTGKAEHRRAPIDPVERFRRNAARRRAAGKKAPSLASHLGHPRRGARDLYEVVEGTTKRRPRARAIVRASQAYAARTRYLMAAAA